MLRLAHLNVRTLIGHFTDFKNMLLFRNFDIIVLNETRLDSTIAINSVNINGYDFVRCDRDRRGGGVGVYIKSILDYTILRVGGPIEQIWLKIDSSDGDVALGVVYKPPDSGNRTFWPLFEDEYEHIATHCSKMICMGDFNTNLNVLDSEAKYVKQKIDSLGLYQMVDQPTRITHQSATLIDYILTTDYHSVAGVRVEPVVVGTDHELVTCNFHIGVSKKCPVFRTARDFRYFDYDQFSSDLQSIPWRNIFDIDDVDKKVDFINCNITTLLDLHAPFRTIRITRKYAPWLTDGLREMMELRDKTLARFKKYKNESDWLLYKQIRNVVSLAVKTEKKAYFRAALNTKDNKQLWSGLKSLNVVKTKSTELPEKLKDVHKINQHFIDSIPKIAGDKELLEFYEKNIKDSNMTSFSFREVEECEIFQLIKKIKTKAMGHDGINMTTVNLCIPFILPFITHVINFCLRMSVFPSSWKKALVVPLPKHSSPSSLDDIRPISILPALSKIIEKVMHKQLQEHLEKNKIIPTEQSGFRPGHSCCTALLNITDEIFNSIDQGDLTILTLLDYTKAFDSIDHELLIAILHYIGLSREAINLLSAYVVCRSQAVIIGDETSTFLSLRCGVPQGSVLGPLLFIIYIACFSYICVSATSFFYADDCQVKLSFRPQECPQAIAALNFDLHIIQEISRKHCLRLNPKKSICQLFGKKSDRIMFLENYGRSITIGGSVVEFVDSARNLGLTVDTDLRFARHISETLRRAYLNLRLLYQSKNYLDRSNRILLCESLVLSHMNFCDVVYGPCLTVYHKNRIQMLQNRCLRFIHSIRKHEPITHTLEMTGWLNMEHRRRLHSSILFYRILNEKSPIGLMNKISLRSDVHSINVRSRCNISIPRHRTDLFTRSFSYQVAKIMNDLKFDYRKVPLSQFRLLLLRELRNDPLYR